MLKKYYKNLVSNYHHALSVDEVDEWLLGVNNINCFSAIEFLFNEKRKTEDYYMAIKILYSRRYLRPLEVTVKAEKTNVKSVVEPEDIQLNRFVTYGNKSEIMDFSHFASLELINVWSCRNLKKTIIPIDNRLKVFQFNNLTQLAEIKFNEASAMRCLSITKCNKVGDFSFIENMSNLLYASLADNKLLDNIEFLEGHQQLVMLHLNMTDVIKNPSTIDVLKSIPNLSYLLIKANKKENEMLREALPECVGNFKW